MQISIVNLTRTESDAKVARVIRAINRQIREDFEPYWKRGATLRLSGIGGAMSPARSQDVRGDAVIYLWGSLADVPDALSLHAETNFGLSHGFVFIKISDRLGEDWSVTLSHEALELIGDANTNVLAAGPHPDDPAKLVFHWYELCDAVQDESYELDGVAVSNFVLPLYFAIGEQAGLKNDFLSTRHGGKTLRSFGVNPGSYVGFFDPRSGSEETFSMRGDDRARERFEIKQSIDRRLLRAQRHSRAAERLKPLSAKEWCLP